MTAADETVVDEQAHAYAMDQIAAAIEGLPDGYRTVFNLYAVEGIPQAEIAEMLGLEHTTVRTQYHRARQKIVAALQKIE
jgi:RNA polymerase sigma-70 factor (ECF subfamily)